MYLQRLTCFLTIFFGFYLSVAVAQNATTPPNVQNEDGELFLAHNVSYQELLLLEQMNVWQDAEKNIIGNVLEIPTERGILLSDNATKKEFFLSNPEHYLTPHVSPGLQIVPKFYLPTESDPAEGKANFVGFLTVEHSF